MNLKKHRIVVKFPDTTVAVTVDVTTNAHLTRDEKAQLMDNLVDNLTEACRNIEYHPKARIQDIKIS